MPERHILCHGADGKPCARLTEAEAERLAAARRGRIVRSRRGEIVRFLMSGSAAGRLCIGWKGSSQTQTQRIRNARGEIIAPKLHLEFKPLVYGTPQG